MYSIFDFISKLFINKSFNLKSFLVSLLFISFLFYMFFTQEYGILFLYNEYIPTYDLNVFITICFVFVLYYFEYDVAKHLNTDIINNNFIKLITLYYIMFLFYNIGYYFILLEPLYLFIFYPMILLLWNNFNKLGNICLFILLFLSVIFVIGFIIVFDIRSYTSIPYAISFNYCPTIYYIVYNSFLLSFYTKLSLDKRLLKTKDR